MTPPPDSLPKADAQLWEAAERLRNSICSCTPVDGLHSFITCQRQRAFDAYCDLVDNPVLAESLLERIAALRARMQEVMTMIDNYDGDPIGIFACRLDDALADDSTAAAKWEKKP